MMSGKTQGLFLFSCVLLLAGVSLVYAALTMKVEVPGVLHLSSIGADLQDDEHPVASLPLMLMQLKWLVGGASAVLASFIGFSAGIICHTVEKQSAGVSR
jgi:hypothetical protein